MKPATTTPPKTLEDFRKTRRPTFPDKANGHDVRSSWPQHVRDWITEGEDYDGVILYGDSDFILTSGDLFVVPGPTSETEFDRLAAAEEFLCTMLCPS